jgi:hypothetical protein
VSSECPTQLASQIDIDPADDVAECDEYNNDWVVGMLPCEE